MKRYSFGAPVKCARCGKATKLVLAKTWEEAASDRGLCPACVNTRPAGDPRLELEKVQGVGPTRADALVRCSIRSLGDLASLEGRAMEILASKLALKGSSVTAETVRDWRDQARDLLWSG